MLCMNFLCRLSNNRTSIKTHRHFILSCFYPEPDSTHISSAIFIFFFFLLVKQFLWHSTFIFELGYCFFCTSIAVCCRPDFGQSLALQQMLVTFTMLISFRTSAPLSPIIISSLDSKYSLPKRQHRFSICIKRGEIKGYWQINLGKRHYRWRFYKYEHVYSCTGSFNLSNHEFLLCKTWMCATGHLLCNPIEWYAINT